MVMGGGGALPSPARTQWRGLGCPCLGNGDSRSGTDFQSPRSSAGGLSWCWCQGSLTR